MASIPASPSVPGIPPLQVAAGPSTAQAGGGLSVQFETGAFAPFGGGSAQVSRASSPLLLLVLAGVAYWAWKEFA